MLRLFRVRAYCLATAVFLSTGTIGASLDILLHTDAGHADACGPGPVTPHDASAHRITPAPDRPPDAGASHCVACHWARSLRVGAGSPIAVARSDEGGLLRALSSIGTALSPVVTHLPPRSPPGRA